MTTIKDKNIERFLDILSSLVLWIVGIFVGTFVLLIGVGLIIASHGMLLILIAFIWAIDRNNKKKNRY